MWMASQVAVDIIDELCGQGTTERAFTHHINFKRGMVIYLAWWSMYIPLMVHNDGKVQSNFN